MRAQIPFVCLVLMLAVAGGLAQTPTTIVQAVPASATASPQSVSPPTAPAASTLNALQELRTANEEILKKQAATLLQLEEIEKAAGELKIYSKRG
jgi:hypothetical protein